MTSAPADVRRHLRRHGERAGVGVGAGIGAHTEQAVVERHDRILEHDRNEAQGKVLRKADVAGKRRLQLLPVDVQLHKMAHLRDDLGEGVVAERRVDIRADGGDEVAQRFARKPAAQIDRHRQRHGALTVGPLVLLLFQNDVDEHGGEVLRDGGVMLLYLLAQAGERHEAHRDMEGVERLRRAGILIGPRQAAQAEGVAARIAGVGVLQLLLARRLVQIEHAVSRGNVHAGLAQVFGKERAEKDDGPAAVGKRMKDLDGDALAVIVKAHEPAVVLAETDGLAGVGDVLLQKRSGRMVRLEIVPEQALADAHGKAREARHTAVDGALERGGIDLPFHPGGEAVDGGIFLLLQRGVENARAVELVPFAVGSRHRRFLLPRGIASDGLL